MWEVKKVLFWKCTLIILSAVPWLYEAMKYFTERKANDMDLEGETSYDLSERYEVHMLREDRYGCRLHCQRRLECEKSDCAYIHLSKICKILGSAAWSIDVCICFVTCEDLIGAMLLASQRGARVRIITDGNMMEFGSQLDIVQQYGIVVQKMGSAFNMHHKFAVVDSKLVIEGSTNWTIQAFSGNWENVIITSDSHVVQAFTAIFNELWETNSV